MKRFLILLSVIFFAASACWAERPELPTQNSIPVLVNWGPKYIATPTITLSPGVITDLGSYLPAGTIGCVFDVWDADILVGHNRNLATATAKWIGYKVASGTLGFKWDAFAGKTCHLWATPNGTATATVNFGIAWGSWEE